MTRLWDRLEPGLAWLSRRAYRVPGMWRVSERLRRKAAGRWRQSPERWRVISDYRGGLRLRLDRASFIGSALYWRGYHSREVELLPRFLGPESVFIDLGANQGEFTVVAARCATRGRVIAVEPEPGLREDLAFNLRLNGLDNVTIIPSAISDRAGVMPLFADDRILEGYLNEGTASFWAGGVRGRIVREVEVETLDAVVERLALSRIDLIKIDVEGAELAVLRGGRRSFGRFGPVMLIELSEENFKIAGYSTTELLSELDGLGYEVFLLGPEGRERPVGPATPLPRVCNAICRPASNLHTGSPGRGHGRRV